MLFFLFPDILCPVTRHPAENSSDLGESVDRATLSPPTSSMAHSFTGELSPRVLKSDIVNNIWLTTLTPSCTLTSVT